MGGRGGRWGGGEGGGREGREVGVDGGTWLSIRGLNSVHMMSCAYGRSYHVILMSL